MSRSTASNNSPGSSPSGNSYVSRRPLLQSLVPALLFPSLAPGIRHAQAAPTSPSTTSREDTVRPFTISVPQAVLEDLQARLARTRWPDEVDGAGWDYGANREYLQMLANRWQQGFDWRTEEAKLNRLAQFTASVDGMDLHFVHVEGKGPNPTPLLLLHGWPDSFWRFQKIIPLLTDPVSHGGRPEDSFTVIAPDIPGFGFSSRPTKPGCTPAVVAGLFAKLMRDLLGYDHYVAHAGDYGATILEQMALLHPEGLAAVHLTSLPPQHVATLNPASLSDEERSFVRASAVWDRAEGGYAHMHSSKPQTLGYGLNDSPTGLLGWITEKFHSWVDPHTPLDQVITHDELLTNVTIYWVTQTIGSSARIYYEKAHHPTPEPSYVSVPTGFAVFGNDLVPPPRSVVARFFDVRSWTEDPRGGHFAALEVPKVLATRLQDFFRPYRRG